MSNRNNLAALLFYLIFFSLLFLQFPLRKELSGNCDTWLALTYSEHSMETIKSLFNGEKMGKPLYPVENPLSYGESSPGIQALIILLKLLGFSDYWTNYFYITLLFSLTAFSIYLFTGNFASSFLAELFAGFLFTCNNMTFAHIDDSIIVFFFIPVLSLHFLYGYFNGKRKKFLIISSILAGIEIYFSFYVFFYQFVMILIFLIYLSRRNHLTFSSFLKISALFFLISFLIAAQRLFFYLKTLYGLDFVEIFEPFYTVKMASLNLFDLILVLPNNLIYPNGADLFGFPMNWGFVRHFNFTGLLALALFIYSLKKWNRERTLIIALAFCGIFLAAGPVFMFNMRELFYSPLYIFYKSFPILGFLRVAVRAHFIFLFALSIAAALSLRQIKSKSAKYPLWVLLFFALHFFENTPFPMKGFSAEAADKIPEIYETIRQKSPNALIVDLPSKFSVDYLNMDKSIFDNPKNFVKKSQQKQQLKVENNAMFVNSWDDLFQYNREILYMKWQNKHKLNLVNGVNGYFPTSRMIFQYYIEKLPDREAVLALKNFGVDFLIYHESATIKGDVLSLKDLENSECLKKIKRVETSSLFMITDC